MKRILIGGSPCTHWSIAQKNNRETEPEGIGWELFKNYLIARDKLQPDYFLYENNKSAAKPIKDQISRELGVPLQYINSALVSAQNRQRFYAHNIPNVPQPEDRGILLRDILESGIGTHDKAFPLTACYSFAIPKDMVVKKQREQVAEPVRIGTIETGGEKEHDSQGQRVYSPDGKSVTINAGGGGQGGKTGLYAVPVNTCEDGKAHTIKAQYYKNGMANFITNGGHEATCVAEPVGIAARTYPRTKQEGVERVKRFEARDDAKVNAITTATTDSMVAEPKGFSMTGDFGKRRASVSDKAYCLAANPSSDMNARVIEPKDYEYCGTKDYPIYEVRDGMITVRGKQYPIRLVDGFYIIRKLTVTECCRLQTLPDDYCRAVSNTQAYKGLGNGWTAEVIIHILSYMDIPKDEPVEVFSFYDGIGTGRYCMDKLGYTNVTYRAWEIDKYAMQIAMSNYPDIIQYGDAFAVRDASWHF
jgi:site-specific DNA-cytosine methylase